MAVLKFTIEADYQKVIELRNEISRLEKQLRSFDGTTPQAEINKIEKQLASSRNEFSRLATEAGRAGAAMSSGIRNSASGVSSAMGQVRQQISGVTQETKAQGAAIDALFSRLTSAAAKFGISLSALGLGNRIMQTRGEFQQLEVAFNTMLGSAEKGNALMQQLVHTAAITPFDLKGVAQGAKQLLAYGIQAEEVNETITKLGDIAAGLSIPLNDLVYLYGTTMTQGRMFTMDLRQFQGRGVPIADELAKQFGVAKSEVAGLVSSGKVGAAEFKKAIMGLAGTGSQFGGLMETQSKTITGQLSNISDAIDVMFNEIGKSSEGVINKGLNTVSYLVENYEKVGKVLLVVATAFGTYKASLMATQAMEKLKQNNAVAGLEAEIAKINEEIAARERLNGVIAQQPTGTAATGKTPSPPNGNEASPKSISTLQGDLAERQAVLDAIKQEEAVEKQAKLNIAATEHNAAQSQLAMAQEKQKMAQSSLAVAQQEFDVAVKEKTEAEARVLLANQEVDARKAALLEAQKSGNRSDVQKAQSSLDSASFERDAAYAAQRSAQSNFDTAFRNLDTASEASRTAAAQAQTAAINEQTAAENMHNAAVEKANAVNALNAGETDKATIAARKEAVEIEAKAAALQAEIQRKRELLAVPSGKESEGGTVSCGSETSANPIVAEAQSRLSEQEEINAALDAELQKRVDIAQQELTSAQTTYDAKASALDLADQEYIKANENLSVAIKNKEAVDEKVKSAREYLDSLKEASEVDGVDYDDEINPAYNDYRAAVSEQQAAAKEVETAAEAANTAEKNLNTAAEEANTAQTGLNTAQTNANTASQRMQSASEAQATVARTTNTGATAGNTTAITTNTLATRASALANKAWVGIQTLFTGAVNATKNAFIALKVAIATNPLGMLLTAVTTAISMLPILSDWLGLSGDEASASSDKFGEAADKTISKINTLYEVINHSSSESKVYKDAMSELKGICEEYGIVIDKEGNLLDQVNGKRKELIALIQEEGAARIYANGVASAGEDYNKTIDDAQKAIEEGLSGVRDDMKGTFASILTQSVTGNMEELTAAFNRMEEIKNTAGLQWDASAVGRQALQEYTDLVKESTLAVKNAIIADKEKELASQGITDADQRHKLALEETKDAIKSVDSVSNIQIKNMVDGNNTYKDRVDALNRAKEETSGLIVATSGLAGEEKRIATQAYLANQKVGDLKTSVEQVLKECANKHYLDIAVNLDDTAVPDWMKTQSGLDKKGGPSQKDVNTAKNRAAFWTSQLNEMRDKKVDARYFGNKRYTKEEVAKRVAQYTNAALQGQEELDKNESAKANAKSAKTTKSTGKSAAEIQAERDKKIAEENKRWSEQEAKDAQERAYAIEQARIDGMKDGLEKTLAQIELDYRKEKDQIDKQEDDLLKKKQEHAKKLWLEKDEKNKNKIFEDTEEYKSVSLTEDDKSGIEAQRTSAELKYNKEVEEVRKSELGPMRDYIKEYGTVQEQRLALIEEWNEKIAKATSEGERLTFVQQKEQAVQNFDNEQMKKSVDWEQLFGDVGNMSVEQLQSAKGQLKEKLQDGSLNPDDYKTIVDQINEINDAIVDAETNQSIFSGLITEHAKERKKLEMEVAEALERQTQAQQELAAANTEHGLAQNGVNTALQNIGMGDLSNPNVSAADAQETVSAVSRKYGADSIETKQIQSAFDRLATSTTDVTDAQEKFADATNKATDAQNKEDNQDNGENFYEKYSETFDKIIANVGDVMGLASTLGIDAESEAGQILSSAVNGVNSGIGALKDFASGNYVGAAMNALNAVGSFSDALGITGDSDATLASDIEKLTTQNEALQYAVEELTDEMKDASFTESVDIYKTQLEAMQQSADNTQEMMSRSGSAHKSGLGGSHSSNSKINDSMSSSDWSRISKIVDKTIDSAGDFWELTSSEMKQVAVQAPDLYAKIKNLADDGYRNAAEYMDEYIEYGDKIDELTDAFKEKMTGITLDSAKSDIESMLQDLDSSFSDAADQIETYLRNAIISAILSSDKYTKRLTAWRDDLAEKMKDGTLTKEEAEESRNDFLSLHSDIRDETNAMLEAAGLDSVASGQSASYGESSSITQDQASEISGRLTAIQWTQQTSGQSLTLANAKLDTVIVNTAAISGIADDMRDMIAQSYLELQMINENTAAVVKPIQNISEKMDAVEKKIKNL